jgi:hypothetical protein
MTSTPVRTSVLAPTKRRIQPGNANAMSAAGAPVA